MFIEVSCYTVNHLVQCRFFCQLDSPRTFPILILKYKHFVEENSLQTVVYNMSAILSQPKCIEHSHCRGPHADCMDPNVQKGLLTLQLNHSGIASSHCTKNATNPTVCAKFIQANIMKKHQSGMIGLCLRRIPPHTKGRFMTAFSGHDVMDV